MAGELTLSQYYIVYPQTVTWDNTGQDSTVSAVGSAPQWTTQDSDTSYISFLPGGDYAIATFNVYASEIPGIPEEWFETCRIIMQSQAMGFGGVFWELSWYADGVGYLDTGTYFEPFRGLYFTGASNYTTNVWHMSTSPFATSDPEDPHADVVTIDGDEYSTYIQYGGTTWNGSIDWYQYYLNDTLQITWWAGGGSGFQEPDDELRLSLFGLVIPGLTPNLEGEFEANRRQFWRNNPY